MTKITENEIELFVIKLLACKISEIMVYFSEKISLDQQ